MSLSSISALSAVASATSGDAKLSTEQAAAKTLAQLIKDVTSGNTASAKADLAALTKQLGSLGATDASSPLGTLLTTLSSDLNSGNLTEAQAAVGSFLTTLKSEAAPGASGHHPHHTDDSTSTAESTFSARTSGSGTDATSQYLATLLQAVQADEGAAFAGNSSSAASSAAVN